MDVVDLLKAFVATAQTGSFTSAAERLGTSNRLTSKYVGELETRIGARLLQRTTRKVGLTPAGEELLARAPALLDELDTVLEGIGQSGKGLSGVIRVSAPVTLGEVYLQDMMGRFLELHPDLSLDLHLNDAYADLARQGIDVAFRVGTPTLASLKVRRLGLVGSHVVASPEYLDRYGVPQEPEDLMQHSCILDTNPVNAGKWLFEGKGRRVNLEVPRRLMVNSAKTARDWAVAGYGVVLSPDFVLGNDLAEGRLVSVLDAYSRPGFPLNAVYLEGGILPRKVRALIDFAIEDIKTHGVFTL